jgi:hypothetical protein
MDTPGNRRKIILPAGFVSKLSAEQEATLLETLAPKEAPSPKFNLDTITINIDRENLTEENKNKAFYDLETNSITVYPEAHIIDLEFRPNTFLPLFQIGRVAFSIEEIFTLNVDTSKIPSCVYYVPSKSQKDSQLPFKWPYASGMKEPACTCPNKGFSNRKPGMCDKAPMLTSCSDYSAIEPQRVATVIIHGEQYGTVEAQYFFPRKTTYLLTVPEQESIEFDSVDDLQRYVDDTTESSCEIVSNMKSKPEDSYFKLVFT